MPSTAATRSAWADAHRGSVLKIVFLTLFIDLVSFSIILPLFPSMLEFYMQREADSGLLGFMVSELQQLSNASGNTALFGVTVLFGGVLGSLFSLLQFLFAPLIGTLSDRFGRKPVLLVSIAGLAASYLMWFFAGRFITLVLARTLGGIMSGNISTATAAVADVTDERTRSRGMAVVGVAFAVGFIIGPAIGGISAHLDLTAWYPKLADWGVNPFSVPALLAFVFSMFNVVSVAIRFPETLPDNGQRREVSMRTANPLALFHSEQYPGVSLTNLTNFAFLTIFSGMEFSLTFLAVERLNYTPRQNAYMFVFIGVLLALIQGGYVRRFSNRIGLRQMSAHGFLLTVPGLALVGLAHSTPLLYAGLALLAIGPAMVFPCLTSLASLYAPADDQGRIIGLFRSLGALARAVGPLVACALYWRWGAAATYYIGAAALLAPFIMALALPAPPRTETV